MAKRDVDARLRAFRAYIDLVMTTTGWQTPTEVARKAGLAVSTVNRPYNKDVNFVPKTTTLGEIVKASGVPLPSALLLTQPPMVDGEDYMVTNEAAPGDAGQGIVGKEKMEPDEVIAVEILASLPPARAVKLFREAIRRQKARGSATANPPAGRRMS